MQGKPDKGTIQPSRLEEHFVAYIPSETGANLRKQLTTLL
jgi:hypothetical protein